MNKEEKIAALLEAWEETYKKGQLTLWVFFSLVGEKKYADEIKAFVEEKSNGTMSCEDQSLYRILRKFEHVEVLTYELRKGDKGPDRKYYYFTPLGEELFRQFVDRNISLFYSEDIKRILNR